MIKAETGVLTRREREKLQRRAEILEAAKELFYEKGYQNTTIDEIAARSEYGKGTIYLYFQGKDDLYVSIIEAGYAELEERLNKAIKGKRNPEQKIKAIFLAFIEHCLENRQYFSITQYFLSEQAQQSVSAELKERIYQLSFRLLSIGSRAAQEAIDSGVFRKGLDATDMSLIGWRLATGLLDVTLAGGLGEQIIARPDIYENAIDMLIDGAKKK
jgi:AcrR family transcriptional regulator